MGEGAPALTRAVYVQEVGEFWVKLLKTKQDEGDWDTIAHGPCD